MGLYLWLILYSRDELLQRIKDHLCKLEPGDFLTLHGMPVSGKLVLASEALRDPEVTLRHFPDGVIWFRVGIISSREKLLRSANKLTLYQLNQYNYIIQLC